MASVSMCDGRDLCVLCSGRTDTWGPCHYGLSEESERRSQTSPVPQYALTKEELDRLMAFAHKRNVTKMVQAPIWELKCH